MRMWEDYKVFRQNCHYELDGKVVGYWDLTSEEQEDVEIKDDDTIFIEEFRESSERAAYKYFKQEYGGDEELPSYYILEKADGGWFEHGDTKKIFSDLNYGGF